MSDSDGGDNDGGTGDLNVFEESPYYPDLKVGPSIPHYYGDYVRQLFMLAGAMMLIFSPFLAASNPGILPFEIGGAIVVAILAALTNPVNKLSMLANAIVAGIGVVTYELLALNSYFSGAMIAFIEREAITLIFLCALYFSLKTLRNMVLQTIGKKNASKSLIQN